MLPRLLEPSESRHSGSLPWWESSCGCFDRRVYVICLQHMFSIQVIQQIVVAWKIEILKLSWDNFGIHAIGSRLIDSSTTCTDIKSKNAKDWMDWNACNQIRMLHPRVNEPTKHKEMSGGFYTIWSEASWFPKNRMPMWPYNDLIWGGTYLNPTPTLEVPVLVSSRSNIGVSQKYFIQKKSLAWFPTKTRPCWKLVSSSLNPTSPSINFFGESCTIVTQLTQGFASRSSGLRVMTSELTSNGTSIALPNILHAGQTSHCLRNSNNKSTQKTNASFEAGTKCSDSSKVFSPVFALRQSQRSIALYAARRDRKAQGCPLR